MKLGSLMHSCCVDVNFCLTGCYNSRDWLVALAFAHNLAPMVRAARFDSCGALGVSSDVPIGIPAIGCCLEESEQGNKRNCKQAKLQSSVQKGGSGCNYSTADLTCTSQVVSDEVCTTY
eukprot:7977-Heterococcus_DN1.PRE.2